MKTPYSDKPASSFWKKSVARPAFQDVDPVIKAQFSLSLSDKIATAGICFAQHIARTLVREGYHYLVTEPGPTAENYGLFPARFGNIYSTLQLLQLFQRAYGLFEPKDQSWRLADRIVDPFRPLAASFETETALAEDRRTHLAAVRQMFETCNVFIFTLGLTETWMAAEDGAVVPLAPGVSDTVSQSRYVFSNRSVFDMVEDMTRFIEGLRTVNPGVRVILTVSPVPLIATYEPRHVLVSTVYSKSALRVVAEMVSTSLPDVAYFPSYEIITGHHTHYAYFAEDLREVLPKGVDHVMRLFAKHYLAGAANAAPVAEPVWADPVTTLNPEAETDSFYHVVCDEEAIDV
jgi:GSCFA family